MEQNFATAVLMPVALGVIMLGLGLHLTLDDFRRVARYPRAVVVALLVQTVLLPAVAYAIAKAYALPPELAVGLMLLAASPGGATANLFSHLARGDVALNITLTAVNSLLSLVTLPILVGLSLDAFMGADKTIPLQADKVIQVFAIVLIPVAIGMTIHAKKPEFSKRLERPVKISSAVFLLLVIVAAVLKEKDHLVEYFAQVGLPSLLFNLASLTMGYAVPRLVGLPSRQATAIGMEIGIHNGTLAIAIASSPLLLNNTTMAIPPAIYSLIMFFTAGAFASFMASRNGEAPSVSTTGGPSPA